MMSNPNDQGIPYDRKDIKMIMALFNKQQQNDAAIRRDYEKIMNNFMRQQATLFSPVMSILVSNHPRCKVRGW